MTRDELLAITRWWISLWCVPVDWALFDRLHADDFVDYSAAGREPHKKAYAESLRAFTDAFPDLHTMVEDIVVDEANQRVAVRWSAEGTNLQRFMDIGPTNKSTHITGIEIIEIRQGLIIKRWGEWDISDHTTGD